VHQPAKICTTPILNDVLDRGKQATFVRTDELLASWKIFSPLLEQLERENVQPVPYLYGSRGPAQADDLIRELGFRRTEGYLWREPAK
jgi:glucose-6-phosphate 1-dehydrogenase